MMQLYLQYFKSKERVGRWSIPSEPVYVHEGRAIPESTEVHVYEKWDAMKRIGECTLHDIKRVGTGSGHTSCLRYCL